MLTHQISVLKCFLLEQLGSKIYLSTQGFFSGIATKDVASWGKQIKHIDKTALKKAYKSNSAS